MSRLGDQIHTLRVQKGLDRKKIAKKAGIADKFLQEVEEGRRIPTDEQAARILSLLGEKGDLSEAFTPVVEESTPPVRPVAKPKPAKPAAQRPSLAQPNEQWNHALAGLMQDVPVLNIRGEQVAKRTLVLEKGKIQGFDAGSVLYLKMPDDSLRALGIHEGDTLFMVRESALRVGTIAWVRAGSQNLIGTVEKIVGGYKVGPTALENGTFKMIARAIFAQIRLP